MAPCIILREGVRSDYVGPFDSEQTAREWQERDEAAHGELTEWTIMQLTSPTDAWAEAERA